MTERSEGMNNSLKKRNMMKQRNGMARWMLGVVLAGLVSSGNAAEKPSSPRLEAGLLAEEGENNLEGAIKIYLSIVADYQERRAEAAQATFRTGECLRALGRMEEAEKSYRRMVKEFPEFKHLVGLSEKRLGGKLKGTRVKTLGDLIDEAHPMLSRHEARLKTLQTLRNDLMKELQALVSERRGLESQILVLNDLEKPEAVPFEIKDKQFQLMMDGVNALQAGEKAPTGKELEVQIENFRNRMRKYLKEVILERLEAQLQVNYSQTARVEDQLKEYEQRIDMEQVERRFFLAEVVKKNGLSAEEAALLEEGDVVRAMDWERQRRAGMVGVAVPRSGMQGQSVLSDPTEIAIRYRDSVLDTLLERKAEMELEAVALEVQYGDNHPSRVSAERRRLLLEKQIADRAEAVSRAHR